MIWRWFGDWRERRAAMRELGLVRQAEENALEMRPGNPLSLALTSAQTGDLPDARAYWDEARRLMPNVILRSRASLEILFALQAYDEAETVTRESSRRFPAERFFQTGLAEIAFRRGDFEESAKRWQRIYYGPEEMEGDYRTGQCFQKLGRIDDAEAMFKRAAARPEADFQPMLELARISEGRGDWREARARWRRLIERFNHPRGIAGEIWALMELGELATAQSMMDHAWPNHLRDLDIAVTRAHLAERCGDVTAACEAWDAVRQINPRFTQGYSEGARCLYLVRRHTEADAVMLDAITRFPSEAWPFHGHARLAHDRREWPVAIERWLEMRRRFPGEKVAVAMGTEALRAAGREDEAVALGLSAGV